MRRVVNVYNLIKLSISVPMEEFSCCCVKYTIMVFLLMLKYFYDLFAFHRPVGAFLFVFGVVVETDYCPEACASKYFRHVEDYII